VGLGIGGSASHPSQGDNISDNIGDNIGDNIME